MNGKPRYRAATVLVAIVLLLGGLGILSATLAAAQPKMIQGVVTKEGEPTTLLEGVTVTLVDAHGQKDPLVALTGPDGKYTFTPGSGFYFVTVSTSGFFDNKTDVFRFDGTANLLRDLEMEEMPSAVHDLTVHVEDDVGVSLGGAVVEVYNVTPERTSFIAGDLTNATTGNVSFPSTFWSGAFEIRTSKEGFEVNVTTIAISGDAVVAVSLDPGIKLVGIAREPDGTFVEDGLVAYLYNNDTGTDDAKRLIVANVSGSSYTFYAFTGNYTLIVDGDGKAANTTSLFVHTGMTPEEKRIDTVLNQSPEESVNVRIEYTQNDWNNLSLRRTLNLNYDSGILGLPLSDLRHLRLQIDIALGDGDGILSQTEIDVFRGWLLDSGPKFVDTENLYNTTSQFYRSDVPNGTTDFNVTVDIPASGRATIVGYANYTIVGASIDPGKAKYFVNLTGSHDTNKTVYINRTFTISVVPGYERTLTNVIGTVDIQGYTSILVDPLLDVGDFQAEMHLEPSLNGTAIVQVIGPEGRFTELNVSVENYTAIVPTEENMTFSAAESTDPNTPDGRVSPDSNFTWVFDNASRVEMAYGIKPNVSFSVMGNYTGNLTIVETGGNQTFRDFTLFVDGLKPVARIENNVTGFGIDANGTDISIPEGSAVKFFGGNSTDFIHSDLEGEVANWRWDMDGDGEVDTTGKDVEWTFEDPGNFTVNLTAIDQAGHESVNATMTVFVEDGTPPVVSFDIKDEEGRIVDTLTESVSYIFDASATTDNQDALEDLTFEWSFGDGTESSGYNVTHTYSEFGVYTLILNVTDQAGNEGNSSREFVVEVDTANRPDLEIEPESLVVEPESPEESSIFGSVVITISLNVTNKEERARAEAVQVDFLAFRFGEEPGDPINIDPKFFDEDGTPSLGELEPGEKKTIKFTWVTGPQGNYTLRVNVTDVREPDIFIGPKNSAETQIDVRQAFWVTPAIIAAAVGVIGGIPAAIYLRRRFRGRLRLRERITKK